MLCLMVRKEQFALGVGLVTSVLALALSKSLAWFILIVGLGLIFDFYLRDFIWGTDRLSKEDIQAMPAEEYKRRVLGNPRTERWVNWRSTGYDAFKKHMRKIAREAVIFMLITSALCGVSGFAVLYHEANKPAVPVTLDMSKSIPLPPPPPGFIALPQTPYKAPSLPTPSTLDLITSSLWFGLTGFPAGLALWLLYRAIRFAILG